MCYFVWKPVRPLFRMTIFRWIKYMSPASQWLKHWNKISMLLNKIFKYSEALYYKHQVAYISTYIGHRTMQPSSSRSIRMLWCSEHSITSTGSRRGMPSIYHRKVEVRSGIARSRQQCHGEAKSVSWRFSTGRPLLRDSIRVVTLHHLNKTKSL